MMCFNAWLVKMHVHVIDGLQHNFEILTKVNTHSCLEYCPNTFTGLQMLTGTVTAPTQRLAKINLNKLMYIFGHRIQNSNPGGLRPEALYNTEFYERMGKKQTPNSSV